jgi:hypothetical protein
MRVTPCVVRQRHRPNAQGVIVCLRRRRLASHLRAEVAHDVEVRGRPTSPFVPASWVRIQALEFLTDHDQLTLNRCRAVRYALPNGN